MGNRCLEGTRWRLSGAAAHGEPVLAGTRFSARVALSGVCWNGTRVSLEVILVVGFPCKAFGKRCRQVIVVWDNSCSLLNGCARGQVVAVWATSGTKSTCEVSCNTLRVFLFCT